MKYRLGQRVRIAARSHDGHHRTPGYVKGRTGTIVRLQGMFTNPETRAYGSDGLPMQSLYLIDLELDTNDRILVDIFEHWLEEAA
jgi:nitrile hydratase